jgi:O-antigen/teichoic acid export membrane protein
MIIQDTFIKHDGFIITATLDLKKKVYLTVRSAIIFIVCGFILINNFGITGLCISLIGGKFLLFIGQRNVLRNKIQYNSLLPFLKRIQPLAISFIMLGAAYYLSAFIQPVSLLKMIAIVPATFILSFLIFYAVGLRREQRAELVRIISSIKFLKSN